MSASFSKKIEEVFPFTIDGVLLSVIVSRKTIKRARIKIENDLSIHLSVPLSWNEKAIYALLKSNLAWIASKRASLLQKQKSYNLGADELFYRGDIWKNVVIPVLGGHVNVEAEERQVYSGRKLQGEALAAWYKAEARFLLPARLRHLAEIHRFFYQKCMIRQTRRKWGSWRSDGIISLNSKLILAPENVSDAIMLHELAHTVHPNHSKSFWALLYKLCPHWDEASEWLKAYQSFMDRCMTHKRL